jgi:hypothetical protein
MFYSITSLVLLSVALIACSDANAETLRHVNVIFRHGDRSIQKWVPGLHPESDWEVKIGELTSRGMHQHFNLGRMMRKWYGKKLSLSPVFRPEEIRARSTDMDRTLQSALSDLAGLYFVEDADAKWVNDELPWVPVPVHTIPFGGDYLLADTKCDQANIANHEVLSQPEVAAIEEENAPFYQQLAKWTGVAKLDLLKTFFLQDGLWCEGVHGLSRPDWATEDVLDKLFNQIRHRAWQVMFGSPKEAKLRAGVFTHEVVENFKAVAKAKDGNAFPVDGGNKFRLYSDHDSGVASYLSNYRVFNGLQPPYAAAVLIELHQNEDSTTYDDTYEGWFVRMRYFNYSINSLDDDIPEPTLLTLPGCDVEDCPLSKFIEISEPLGMEFSEYEEKCKAKRK